MSYSALTVYPLAETAMAVKVMLSDMSTKVWIARSLLEDGGDDVERAIARDDGKPIEINVASWKAEQENWE